MELENTKQGESLCCVYAAYAGGRGLSRGNDSAMDGWIWVLLRPGRSHVISRIAKGNRTHIYFPVFMLRPLLINLKKSQPP